MSVAEEFFGEREWVIHATSGTEYLSSLSKLFAATPTLDQGGLTPAPFEEGEARYFFRGQTDSRHGLNSSLFRTLDPNDLNGATPPAIEKLMRSAETRVLQEARKQGLGRNLTSLELLTVLQHHLIPTRLIDVSASWKVALYFASEAKDMVDGRMFVIAAMPSLWSKFTKSLGEDVDWPSPPEHRWQHTTWPLLLPFTDPRMISQQGYFLAGGLATNTGGHHQYWIDTAKHPPNGAAKKAALTQKELRQVSTMMIKFPANAGDVRRLEKELKGRWTATGLTVRIPGELKPQIRESLKSDDGISADSIYPPIDESLRLLKHAANCPDRSRDKL